MYPEDEDLADPAQWQIRLSTGFANPADSFAPVGDRVTQNYDAAVSEVVWADGLYALRCVAPEDAPADLYSLGVFTTTLMDCQPAAVAIREDLGGTYTFVHLTDVQLDDPSGNAESNELNSGDYPGAGLGERPTLLFENEIYRELSLLRPAFAIVTGDLIYGTDVVAQNDAFTRIAENSQVPLFMAAGNHDGYAYFNQFIGELSIDGLEHFARGRGPLYYSFDVGELHFVVLNSYDGSPERRHAGNLIVASPVDNWGGFLGETQFAWLKADLAAAREDGRVSLLFMHHDPRGPFTANEPYPTHPISPFNTEYWNYESEAWDSNPYDHIEGETPQYNTGTKLLAAALAQRVPLLFLGHLHADGVWRSAAGDPVLDRFGDPVDQLIATASFTVVQTTTAASSVERSEAGVYDGYRVVQVRGDAVDSLNALDEDFPAASVPAGNLWFDEYNNDGSSTQAQIVVTNGLPNDLPVTVEFYLPALAQGYEILNEEFQRPTKIADWGLGDNGAAVLYATFIAAGTAVPGDAFPVEPGRQAKTHLTARPHPTNQPPTAEFVMEELDGDNAYRFDASASTDPDGDALRRFWDFGDGFAAAGAVVEHRYLSGGPLVVKLTVMDENGGQAVAHQPLRVSECCADREHHNDEDLCGGCGVVRGAPASPDWLMMLAAALGVLLLRVGLADRRSA
jgi:hypothetical protein